MKEILFNNLKILVNKMKKEGWVLDVFRFEYNEKRCFVIVKRLSENEKKNTYDLAELKFIDEADIHYSIVGVAEGYKIVFEDIRMFREFFNIKYCDKPEFIDVLKNFSRVLSQFIPTEINICKKNLPENMKNIAILELNRNIGDGEDKIYLYKIIRLGKTREGKQKERSFYTDNKARLLRNDLYEAIGAKNDGTITFGFTENQYLEKSDRELLDDYSKR